MLGFQPEISQTTKTTKYFVVKEILQVEQNEDHVVEGDLLPINNSFDYGVEALTGISGNTRITSLEVQTCQTHLPVEDKIAGSSSKRK